MDMKQKIRALKRNIKLKLDEARNLTVFRKFKRIKNSNDIDEKTKEELRKYAQAAVDWKKIQGSVESAQEYLKGTAGDTNGGDEKDYIEDLWEGKVENALPRVALSNNGDGVNEEFCSMKEKLKEILQEQSFEGRGRSVKANNASIKRYMQATRILNSWRRRAQRQERECERKFEKLLREPTKK